MIADMSAARMDGARTIRDILEGKRCDGCSEYCVSAIKISRTDEYVCYLASERIRKITTRYPCLLDTPAYFEPRSPY